MTLAAGTKLGSYEILAAIGAGGMGEVYRARDAKLGRDVALKVLPEAFARDSERMARFQREAKLLASLNHPNIAAIYGFEDSGLTHALVMELVEGPTLADRIASAPIPIDEALRIARQIADALEYAHERGIVHRDLKPANVKVTPDDAVKVLDFGLAKAIEGDASSMDINNSPTMSRMATMQGVLLGTAAYMSPEQAKAKPVDRRADIWAFGCVLYEMLTGKMAFYGETVTDTLAAVIRAEPDWTLLPSNTPARVRVLLQRCLQKDAKQRLQAIGDARISLDEVLSGATEPTSSAIAATPVSRRQTILWSSAVALIAAAIAGLVVWIVKPSPAPPQRAVTRTVINLPLGQRLAGFNNLVLALSPNGSQLAYVATTEGEGGATQQIYLRKMDSLAANPVPGTEGAVDPFFSPDGQWLGFFADGKLKKISVTGGPAQILADDVTPTGASWSKQGTIAFSSGPRPIYKVSDGGGTPQPLTHLERGEIGHTWPDFLPGGKAVLFSNGSGIFAQPIGTGGRRNLTPGGISPRYLSSGYLIYAQGGDLMAVRFDPQRLAVKGTPVPVVGNVIQEPVPAPAQYSVSATGSLVYVPGSAQASQSRLVWVRRSGTEQPLPAPAGDYGSPRLSPDGQHVALVSGNQIWIYDLARDTLTRFTFGGSVNMYPAWTPDGKRIAFASNRQGPVNLYWQKSDGSGGLERLTTNAHIQVPLSWSPNGQLLAFEELAPATGGGTDIWVLRMSDRKAETFLQNSANVDAPQFSPDGRWMAYVSDESGRNEIYVQPYPGPGGKYQISTDGGTEPVWNRNGRELFYRSGDKMMSVDITTEPSFSAGNPKMLFQGGYISNTAGAFPAFDVSPDGQRFLMLKPVTQQQAAPTQINVVLNWAEELKRLVPVGTK
ncbi:MAG: protein kinase [Candidatus Acidiferrales bacterium]